MPALTVEDEQRMVDVLAVIAVIEGAFLLSVYRIVGGVEVQKDLLWSAIALPLSKVGLEEDFGYLAARAFVRRVLKSREGRLARQIGAALGQCEPQESLNRGSSRKKSESFWSS